MVTGSHDDEISDDEKSERIMTKTERAESSACKERLRHDELRHCQDYQSNPPFVRFVNCKLEANLSYTSSVLGL